MTTVEKLHRLTQLLNKRALAQAAGLHPNTLIFILSGRVAPSLPSLRALAAVLGVSIGWLVDDAKGWEKISRVPPVESYTAKESGRAAHRDTASAV